MNQRLIIAEKETVAGAIVDAMGGGVRHQGYWQVGNDQVSFASGHLLRLLEPHEYDERFAKWVMSDLPHGPIPWRWAPGADARSKAQLKVILGLLKTINTNSGIVLHAGDPDDEGQLIVDSILEYAGSKAPVKRLLINDNTKKVVLNSLASLSDNALHYPMGLRALARSVGDQYYGINMTRAYTLAAQAKGYQGVFHIGRVQTAITGMVVRRDLANEAHVKVNYYQVKATFALGQWTVPASYKIQATDPVGDNKELSDEDFARQIAQAVQGKPARVVEAGTEKKTKQPPLPYNLLKLQAEASSKFKITPKEVMAITQSLKDKHKLITYNRSDCQYLSDEQHEVAPAVLDAIAQTATMLGSAAKAANPQVKSRAFNSSKVGAHHGIVPTETAANFSDLTDQEQKIYLLIARVYIAQFFPLQEYNQTSVLIECAGYTFKTSSRVILRAGWQALYRNDVENDEIKLADVECSDDLSQLPNGQTGSCSESRVETKQTQPPKRYTIKTLLLDLTRASRYIRDPELRALLVARDKGKDDEHGGIGTPATRDSHLDNLFERDYLAMSGDHVISTKTAREFYGLLDDSVKYPDMSAIWEGKFKEIETGTLTPVQFVQDLLGDIAREVERLTTEGLAINVVVVPCPACTKPLRQIKGTKGVFWSCTGRDEGCDESFDDIGGKPLLDKFACPDCARPLRRTKGQKGFFWGCTGYNVPEEEKPCKASFEDKAGKPVLQKKPKPVLKVSDQHLCKAPDCGKGLSRRPGKKRGTFWWGCSGYPTCTQTYLDKAGKPNYDAPTKEKSA